DSSMAFPPASLGRLCPSSSTPKVTLLLAVVAYPTLLSLRVNSTTQPLQPVMQPLSRFPAPSPNCTLFVTASHRHRMVRYWLPSSHLNVSRHTPSNGTSSSRSVLVPVPRSCRLPPAYRRHAAVMGTASAPSLRLIPAPAGMDELEMGHAAGI